MNAGTTWRLQPGQTLQHRQWDGECVLYNDLSGDTHLLGEAAVEILLALRRGPATRDALAAMLEADGHLDALELTGGSSLSNPMYLFRGAAPRREFAATLPRPLRLGFGVVGKRLIKYRSSESIVCEK